MPIDIVNGVPVIALSDDSSDGSIAATDQYNASGSASDTSHSTAQKPRNIAVKKGTPVGQIPEPGISKEVDKKQKNVKNNLTLIKAADYLNDFNPENSRREKNKRHVYSRAKPPTKKNNTSMYDERGRIRITKEDICDCLDMTCPGCHFACQNCGSSKCGIKCRVNRKWAYEGIEHDGKDKVITNPLVTTVNYRS